MKLEQLIINNYKSFPPKDTPICFHSSKTIIIGKNNSGKSNILTAIDFLLGNKDPRYIKIASSDYYDITKPLKVECWISVSDVKEIYQLTISDQAKNGCAAKLSKGQSIYIKFIYNDKKENDSENIIEEPLLIEQPIAEADEVEEKKTKFTLTIGSFQIHRKVNDVRASICKMISVASVRNIKAELSGSQWTIYGQLMKSVLENSQNYGEIKIALNNLNQLIEESLSNEKNQILKNAKFITYITDLKFQLTKDGYPSELLRNLELYVKENDKFIHVEETGTGTQSALIIAILEIALKVKHTHTKLFCIDEPELYLHPQGVRFIGSLFREFITEKNVQLIITSHSSILLSSFQPHEIIRTEKPKGYTEVHQLQFDFVDEGNKVSRKINSAASEMFFADKVFLVEGETELVIFPNLSQYVKTEGIIKHNFLKNNICTVSTNGKGDIINYIRILDEFSIPWCALYDNDFLTRKSSYSSLCKHLEISSNQKPEDLREELLLKNVRVLSEGEAENLIPITDIIAMTGKTDEQIIASKADQNNKSKTSNAFENDIFQKSKPDYAYDIFEYYSLKESSPFDEIIRWVVSK